MLIFPGGLYWARIVRDRAQRETDSPQREKTPPEDQNLRFKIDEKPSGRKTDRYSQMSNQYQGQNHSQKGTPITQTLFLKENDFWCEKKGGKGMGKGERTASHLPNIAQTPPLSQKNPRNRSKPTYKDKY